MRNNQSQEKIEDNNISSEYTARVSDEVLSIIENILLPCRGFKSNDAQFEPSS